MLNKPWDFSVKFLILGFYLIVLQESFIFFKQKTVLALDKGSVLASLSFYILSYFCGVFTQSLCQILTGTNFLAKVFLASFLSAKFEFELCKIISGLR